MSQAVSLFVIVFTLANILACVWLIWWTTKRRAGAASDGKTVEKTGHVWDGDLEEYNNPLPRWWLWLFLITIVFGIVYLIVYPGLGNFAGVKQWTQLEQHAAETAAAQAKLKAHLAGLEEQSVEQLSRNDKALGTARNLFGLYCSTCHGSDARGAKGFPNLADADWLWGGTADAIHQSIANGRIGTMPPWSEVLGEQGVDEVAHYVLSLSGAQVDGAKSAAGQARYAVCVGCHGVDGKGNQALGAPNLTDDVWLYGKSMDALRETIGKGRANQMPAHDPLLGPMKTKLLAAYVLSLSTPVTPP